MAETIEIKVKATDQASSTFRNISGEVKGLGALLKTQLAGDIAAGMTRAFDSISKSVKGLIVETEAYTDQVRELSTLTGGTLEDSSRLLNVTDDLFISYSSLTTGLEAAVRKGIDPSVKSIAKLSDQYLKLEPGLARSKFLMDTFGRSGMDMARVMEMGGQAIMEQSAAVDENLIVSQKSLQTQIEMKQATDEWNDALLSVKMAFVQDLLPTLTEFMTTAKETVIPVLKGVLDAFNSLPDGAKQGVVGFGIIAGGLMSIVGPAGQAFFAISQIANLLGIGGAAGGTAAAAGGAAAGGGGLFASLAAGATALGAALVEVVLPLAAIAAGLLFIKDNAEAAFDNLGALIGLAGYKMGLISDQQMVSSIGAYNQRKEERASRQGALSLEQLWTPQGGGGNTTIVYSPALSTASADELTNKLLPIIQMAQRKAR